MLVEKAASDVQAVQLIIESNSVVITFLYGLTFFVVGIAVSLQYVRGSRLRLARVLKLMATFGFLHGIADWGYVFIPIQAAYLPAGSVYVLEMGRVALMALSFAYLFLFGTHLLGETFAGWRRYRAVPWLILVLWVGGVLFTWARAHAGIDDGLLQSAEAWARYSLAFPGALLGAWALLVQQHESGVGDFRYPSKDILLSSLALLFYSVAGGLVLENSVQVHTVRMGAGLMLAYGVIRLLAAFDDEHRQQLEEARVNEVIMRERQRFSHNLQDSVIQSLYSVGLRLEALTHTLPQAADGAQRRLNELKDEMNGTIEAIRENIENLQVSDMTGQSLREALSALVKEMNERNSTNIVFHYRLRGVSTLPPKYIRDIYHIAAEALENAARHAGASRIDVSLTLNENGLVLTVADDGVGIGEIANASDRMQARGFREMAERASILGGSFHVESSREMGTAVIVRIPYPKSFSPNNSTSRYQMQG